MYMMFDNKFGIGMNRFGDGRYFFAFFHYQFGEGFVIVSLKHDCN